MDVKAAVAFGANEPLKIETVQLEGPKEGEVLVGKPIKMPPLPVTVVATRLCPIIVTSPSSGSEV